MSLVLIDGFDLYPAISGDAGMNTVWTFNSTSSMGLDAGRFGGQAIRSSQRCRACLPHPARLSWSSGDDAMAGSTTLPSPSA